MENHVNQNATHVAVETRAEYREDRIHAMHYNAHDRRFIAGAIFSKGDKSGKGSVFLGLTAPK